MLSNNESTSVSLLSKAVFIVYWSSLVVLLHKCLTCYLPASVNSIALKGSQLIVYRQAQDIDVIDMFRQAQEYLEISTNGARIFKRKFSLAAAALFSTSTFQKISKYWKMANIEWITKASYYSIQDKFLAHVVNKNYWEINASITHKLI